jgi:hypothetical protein
MQLRQLYPNGVEQAVEQPFVDRTYFTYFVKD